MDKVPFYCICFPLHPFQSFQPSKHASLWGCPACYSHAQYCRPAWTRRDTLTTAAVCHKYPPVPGAEPSSPSLSLHISAVPRSSLPLSPCRLPLPFRSVLASASRVEQAKPNKQNHRRLGLHLRSHGDHKSTQARPRLRSSFLRAGHDDVPGKHRFTTSCFTLGSCRRHGHATRTQATHGRTLLLSTSCFFPENSTSCVRCST